MFVRVKKVKKYRYGYLVENKWVDGESKQEVKEYLGRVLTAEKEEDGESIGFKNGLFKKTWEEVIQAVVTSNLKKYGFKEEKKGMSKEFEEENMEAIIDFENRCVKSGKEKPVCLELGEGCLYTENLQRMFDFELPEEEERPGISLAKLLTRAGLQVDKKSFVKMYKKLRKE